jgi:hypothetical protein
MRRRTPILIALGVFALAAVVMFVAWLTVDLDATHYVALGLGVLFSLAVGVGLMALVFYSSRSGHDERAHQAQLDVNKTPGERSRSEWTRE